MHYDHATIAFDDAVDYGQPQTSSLAHFLGGEVRFENSLYGGGVHANAGITHG